ncbi:MAG: alpha/beta hydrolase [Chloroflexi bacterium]|nr:alpha/beta hydrolase [Chloroflexota bacterium]
MTATWLARPVFLAVALLVASAAAGAGPAAAEVRAAPGDRPSVVVLIGGLCSSLATGSLPSAFEGPGGLATRLRAEGWTADEILAFSYRGGMVDVAGRWTPEPYDCEDTRARTIADDAATLDRQMRGLLERRPGTDVHVVGYSLGGVVAFAYLALLESTGTWTLPGGGRLATVVSLDSPLGGLPFVEAACGIGGDVCAAVEPCPAPPALIDLGTVWKTGSGKPAGADRSLGRLFGRTISNQSLAALAAASHDVAILTVGNVRDWVYAPIGLFRDVVNFVDTQWLRSDAAGSGLYARAIDSGPATCPGDDPTGASCNHGRVLADPAVHDGIVAAIARRTPAAALTCPAGRGGCLALQPRPSPMLTSTIAPGVVTVGTTGFTTGPVRVNASSRVTLRFMGGAVLAGRRLEIWSRTRTGA